MTEIRIHNEMFVELIDHMGDDMSIVQAAKVSVKGKNSEHDVEGSAGLINYLMRERHGSPFEHNAMKFYVKAPIFVFREFHRHRIASYNEMSGRYTQLFPEFYIPAEDRPIINTGTSAKPEMAPGASWQYEKMCLAMRRGFMAAWTEYEELLDLGVANELAREVLPVGVYSQMYVTMNLRSIFNFLSLRTKRTDARHISRPQREIEMVAEKMEIEVMNHFPIAHAAFNKHGRVAP